MGSINVVEVWQHGRVDGVPREPNSTGGMTQAQRRGQRRALVEAVMLGEDVRLGDEVAINRASLKGVPLISVSLA